jgi:hypothetical protein
MEDHETRVAQPSSAVCLQLNKSLMCEALYQGTTSSRAVKALKNNIFLLPQAGA